MKDVQIVILAAGKGRRMESDKPKVLQEIGGKPFLLHILDSIEKSGVEGEPILVVGYNKEVVMEVAKGRAKFAIQEDQLGTGHAVKVTRDLVPETAKHVLVLYGDHPLVSPETIRELAQTQSGKNPEMTIATSVVDSWDSEWRDLIYDFGRVRRDDDGKLVEIIERRGATEEQLALREVNSGYMAFRTDWMWDQLDQLNTNNTQQEYYLTDLLKFALRDDKHIEAVVVPPEENIGINSKAQLAAAEAYLKSK